MRIWLYLDQFGCCDVTPEEEAEEIKTLLEKELKDKILWRENVNPYDLKNTCPDVYIFDIGGLCYTDYSGNQRINLCKVIAQQVDDHPNCLFVAWSQMTGDYLKFAMEEFLPELIKAPNVFWPDKDYTWEDRAVAKIKEWVK